MSYSFEIFITGLTPAQAIRLFDIDVEEGNESYAVPIDDGTCVFYSGFSSKLANEYILERIDMSLETYASCTQRGDHRGEFKTPLIDNALHKTDSDFLVLSQLEEIIVMRKSGEVIVNADVRNMGVTTLDIFDMPHEMRELGFF